MAKATETKAPEQPKPAESVLQQPAEGTTPAKAKKAPRPMNKTLQTLARIDRLFSEHTNAEIVRMLMWQVAQHTQGKFRMIVEGDPVPDLAVPPA